MKGKNYGALSPFVRKLANQISLGIPVDRALQTFADSTGSSVISRAVALIKEAEKAGGEIDYILESTAKSISEIEKLKKIMLEKNGCPFEEIAAHCVDSDFRSYEGFEVRQCGTEWDVFNACIRPIEYFEEEA